MKYPVIGQMTPHWAGVALDSPFDQFDTPTMNGLARVSPNGRRLEILAIAANNPGHGDCSRFLAECMAVYETICVWDIMNNDLADILTRRGFRDVVEWVDGDRTSGMRWDRPASSPAKASLENSNSVAAPDTRETT